MTWVLARGWYWRHSISMWVSVYDFSCSSVSFVNLGALCLVYKYLELQCSLGDQYVLSFSFFWLVLVWTLFCQILTITACFLDPFTWNIFSIFYPEVMLILDEKVCFLDTAEEYILFSNLVWLLFLLLGCCDFNIESKQSLLDAVILLLWFGFFSPLLIYCPGIIYSSCSWVWLTSSNWKFCKLNW